MEDKLKILNYSGHVIKTLMKLFFSDIDLVNEKNIFY